MAARGQRMWEISAEHQEKTARGGSYMCTNETHKLYSSTIAATVCAAFEADRCVRVAEVLGFVLSTCGFPTCELSYRYQTSGLQKYTEGLLSKLIDTAESLPCQWVD